jgi:hypothetical protein
VTISTIQHTGQRDTEEKCDGDECLSITGKESLFIPFPAKPTHFILFPANAISCI